MNKTDLSKIIDTTLKGNDKDFCMRVWTTNEEIYDNRIHAIGFEGYQSVLDAGCGLGQWSYALSKLNSNVKAIEYSESRYNFCQKLKEEINLLNIQFKHGSIEKLPYLDNEFDAIFCYSVLYFTDYRKSFSEFYRVLKKGGRLYFNTNGLGWYIYNLIDGHNPTDNFDPRKLSIDTIKNTFNYYFSGIKPENGLIVMPIEIIKDEVVKMGFKILKSGSDGEINLSAKEITPFFKGKYYDQDGVYEFLLEK